MNNRRFVPSTASGNVDLRNIPTLLIEKAEVVTGGASAAWGSDAVSGVVNFVLKDNIDGVHSTLQGGISERGDSEELRFSIASGTSFGRGRGSVVAGLDYMDYRGIGPQYERSWGRQEVGIITNGSFASNGLPNFIISPQVRSSNMTPGGLIVSGPLRGTAFGPGGTPYQFNFGQVFGASMIGGEFAGPNPTLAANLGTPVSAVAALAAVNYDFSDRVSGFFELSASRAESGGASQETRDPGNLTIRQDNAYLPASVRQQMIDLGLQTFTMGRINSDVGKIKLDGETEVMRLAAGLNGSLAGGWRWDAYAQYGQSEYALEFGPNNRRRIEWPLAVDAVVNPANGQIVCRSTLTNPNNGCIPVNVFGDGSLQTNPYAFGSAKFWLDYEQTVFAANLQGEPFSTWAGDVSTAIGIEYREEKATGRSDPISQQPQPDGSIGGWLLGNQLPLDGKFDVLEGYLETVIPLARDLPGIQELDLNAAVRRTDYSISGGVTTWKAGLNYRPTDTLRFRGTVSRDIRAPSLDEFFQAGGSSNTFVFDPVLGQSVQIREVQQGSLGLQPEEADSFTAGLVWTPGSGNFNLSLDWFSIEIDGVIGSLGAPRITNGCFAGNTALCDLIVFNPNGTIAFVVNSLQNLDQQSTEGLDLELLYRVPMSSLWGSLPGDLTARLLVTYLSDYSTTDAAGKTDRVGKLSNHERVPGMPEYTGLLNVDWRGEATSLGVQLRYVHSGIFNPTLTVGSGAARTINNNSVPSRTYVNLTAQRDFMIGDNDLQLYMIVNNVLDKDPPWVPAGAAGGINESSTQANQYDVIGRMYRLGARIKF